MIKGLSGSRRIVEKIDKKNVKIILSKISIIVYYLIDIYKQDYSYNNICCANVVQVLKNKIVTD